MEAPLKIMIVSMGEQMVLMIDSHPTAFMISLDDEQAEKIARGIDEMLERRRASGEYDNQEGDMVVKVLSGAGMKTCVITTVTKVSKGVISVEDSSLTYDSRTLLEIDPALPGWYSELVPFDGGEVEKWGLK